MDFSIPIPQYLNMDLSYFRAETKTKEKNVYSIEINDAIASDGGINGSRVAQEIEYLNKNSIADRIDVKINSEGGAIIDGVKIASAIVSSKIPVRAINMGYAVSMAAVVFISAQERRMVDFGLVMIHNPQSEGLDMNEVTDPKRREVMERMKTQLMQLIINRTGIDKRKLSKLMDKETWLNFKEAKELCFVDGSPIKFKNAKVPELTNSYSENISKILEVQNSISSNNLNIKKMPEDLKLYENYLKEKDSKIDNLNNELTNKATEITNLTKEVANYKNQLKEVNAEKADFKKKLEAQEIEIKTIKDEQIKNYVREKVEAGYFDKEKETEILEQATANFEGFKNIVESMPQPKKVITAPQPKISTLVELQGASQTDELINASIDEALGIKNLDLGGLTRFEYLQKNAPKKLDELRFRNSATYNKLRDEFLTAKQA